MQYTTRVVEAVDLVRPPDWWPPSYSWTRHAIGTVDRQTCTACNWERETWSA
jgi:hypothetical protein